MFEHFPIELMFYFVNAFETHKFGMALPVRKLNGDGEKNDFLFTYCSHNPEQNKQTASELRPKGKKNSLCFDLHLLVLIFAWGA